MFLLIEMRQSLLLNLKVELKYLCSLFDEYLRVNVLMLGWEPRDA